MIGANTVPEELISAPSCLLNELFGSVVDAVCQETPFPDIPGVATLGPIKDFPSGHLLCLLSLEEWAELVTHREGAEARGASKAKQHWKPLLLWWRQYRHHGGRDGQENS